MFGTIICVLIEMRILEMNTMYSSLCENGTLCTKHAMGVGLQRK